MHHKITGYLLICVGMLLIFFSVVSTYKVFVNQQPIVPVVHLADMNMQTQLGVMVIPAENLNIIVNIGLFAVFVLLLISAGARIAALGCNLLKIERIYDALSKKQEPLSKEQFKQL